MTAIRRRRQNSTSWSIIEKNSALDHNLLASLHARLQGYGGTFIQLCFYSAAFEGPGCGGHEDRGPVVVHEQRGGRKDYPGLLRAAQGDCREHVRLQGRVGVCEGNPELVAA